MSTTRAQYEDKHRRLGCTESKKKKNGIIDGDDAPVRGKHDFGTPIINDKVSYMAARDGGWRPGVDSTVPSPRKYKVRVASAVTYRLDQRYGIGRNGNVTPDLKY